MLYLYGLYGIKVLTPFQFTESLCVFFRTVLIKAYFVRQSTFYVHEEIFIKRTKVERIIYGTII